MSDDTPWKPPAPGDGDPTAPEPFAAPNPPNPSSLPYLPPSPWAQGGAPSAASVEDGSPLAVPPVAGAASVPTVESALAPAADGGGGRKTRVLAIGTVAVIAVGLGGIFAVRGLASESAGGAASPDELGQQFLDAIEGEDVLGIIDTLLPGERDTLGQPFIDTMTELQRLEVLASDFDLSQLAGLDIQLADRSVAVETTNVDDIVHVGLVADVTVTVDGSAIPIGDLVEDNLPEDALTELRGSKATETDTFDFDLTAVRDDDRWYFSVWYSVAEAARADSGYSEIPVTGVGAVGAESPEVALDRFVEQIETLDVRGIIQSLDPYEAAALQRYAPLFLADIEAAVSEVPTSIDVIEYDFRFEGDGPSRTAFVESFTVVVIEEDATLVTLTYDGTCFKAVWEFPEMGPDEVEFCGDQLDLAEEVYGVEIPTEVQELADAVTEAFADMEPAGVEFRERDGEWYISPLSTVTEAWLKVLRALDRDELDRIVAAAPPAFESMSASLFGVYEDFAGDSFAEEWASDDGHDTAEDWANEDDVAWTEETDPGGTTTGPPVTYAVDECYGIAETAEAMACFDDLLASGEIEAWAIPVALRYPECGIAELTWTSELYGLPDAEYTSALLGARTCFDDLVASGELDEWDVPFEVANVDCFEGRNWYSTFDDEEYDARVSECTGF